MNKLTPLLLSRGIVNASKNQENRIKSLMGTPAPLKPSVPIQSSKLCPEVYDPSKPYSVPFYYKSKCYRGATGKKDSYEQYNKDLADYNEKIILWNKANPKTNVVGDVTKRAQQVVNDRNEWRNDVAQQRDVFASYRDENDRKMVSSLVTQELEAIGYEWREASKSNDDSLIWKVFLNFRNFWNHWGTQIVTASIAAAPETLGLSTLAALVLDIGVDMLVFIIDFIDAMNNPDNESSWKRLSEDALTLVFYGSFTAIGQLIKVAAKTKTIKTFRDFVSSQWQQIKPTIIQFLNFVERKISGNSRIPSSISSWLLNKIKSVYSTINSFVVSKTSQKIAPLFTVALPIVSAFFIVLKLNESAIATTLQPAVEKLVGIPLQRIREIAQGSIPTPDESKKLSKVELPDQEIKKVLETTTATSQEKASESIQKAKEKTKEILSSKTGEQEQLIRTINTMTGPCQTLFENLKKQNKLSLVIVTENGAIFQSYQINGQKGYYLDLSVDPTGVLKINDKGELLPIDCSKTI